MGTTALALATRLLANRPWGPLALATRLLAVYRVDS